MNDLVLWDAFAMEFGEGRVMEKCQRCGEEDEDRRTLFMSCFYNMNELELPFKEVSLMTVEDKDVRSAEVQVPYKSTSCENGKTTTTEGTYSSTERTTDGSVKVSPKGLFTLRVCKDCRGDWMAAIKMWFEEFPKTKLSCGSGIFVRENGANVEITEEEWYRRNPDREPVRWRG